MCDGCMCCKGRNVSSQPEIQNYYMEENNYGSVLKLQLLKPTRTDEGFVVVVLFWFLRSDCKIKKNRKKYSRILRPIYNHGVKIEKEINTRSRVGTLIEIEEI